MKHLALVAACLAVFLFFTYRNISAAPFAYDEADYMYTATRGFVANYLDLPSYSFLEYLRIGLARGRDPAQKAALSRSVRTSGDVFFYRHAHGPVYFYWLNAWSRWNTNEHFMRAVSLAFPILAGLAIYFGCLLILPAAQSSIAAVLGCALYLWSPAVVRTTEIAPHQMFVMWFIVTLLLLAMVLSTGSRRFWYAAVAVTAVAFCTLEVTFVLIAVVLACGYLERQRLNAGWNLAAKSAALFALVVVVLHPAVITKFAFAKSYLYYAYLAAQRKSAWGNVTFLETWSTRFRESPVEWLLIAAALFLWFRHRDLPGRRQAFPFLLFGALMLATMLRVFTTGVRYMLPFLPALQVFAAIVLSGVLMKWRPAARVAAVAVIAAALLLNSGRYMLTHPATGDPHTSLLIAQVQNGNLGTRRLLVPHDDLPTLHYYFPHADLTGYTDEATLPSGSFDAIVHTGDPVRIDTRTSRESQ